MIEYRVMIDTNSLNPNITHHVKPFRDRKLGRMESYNLVMYKYIPLKYVLNMFETKVIRFDNIKKWEDVYENFVDKEDIHLLNSKRDDIFRSTYYGQSWTVQEESDAMWRIYSPKRLSVRVMTAFPLIFGVCGSWNEKHGDAPMWPTIDYVSYAGEDEINKWLMSNSPMNYWAFSEMQTEGLFIKRLEFAHEMEVRVILRNDKMDEQEYIELEFDPHKLFREIVIDPRVSGDEYIRQRDSLVEQGYGIEKIRKSTLYDFKKVSLEIDMSEPCEFPIEFPDKDGHVKRESVFMDGPG